MRLISIVLPVAMFGCALDVAGPTETVTELERASVRTTTKELGEITATVIDTRGVEVGELAWSGVDRQAVYRADGNVVLSFSVSEFDDATAPAIATELAYETYANPVVGEDASFTCVSWNGPSHFRCCVDIIWLEAWCEVY